MSKATVSFDNIEVKKSTVDNSKDPTDVNKVDI